MDEGAQTCALINRASSFDGLSTLGGSWTEAANLGTEAVVRFRTNYGHSPGSCQTGHFFVQPGFDWRRLAEIGEGRYIGQFTRGDQHAVNGV